MGRIPALLLLLLPVGAFAQDLACFPVFSTDFSSSSGWAQVGSGNVTITNGTAAWDHEVNTVNDYWNFALPHAVNDTCFKAEFKFTMEPNPEGSGSGACIFALTAGPLHYRNYDASGSYAYTPQDGIGLLLTSVSATDEDQDNWYLQIEEKDGTTIYADPFDVMLSNDISTYYVVLERTPAATIELNVYTDAAHTALFGTSTEQAHSNVTGLNTVQFGNHNAGNASRQFTGTVDDISICQCTPYLTDGITDDASQCGTRLFAALENGQLVILLSGAGTATGSGAYPIQVLDATGRMVLTTTLGIEERFSPVLSPGTYLARVLLNGQWVHRRFAVR
jgi:hypothetical protein